MDWNKLKFTKLDNEIIEFLFKNPTKTFTGKELADNIGVSQTAISKSSDRLLKMNLITKEKKIILHIKLNRDNKEIFNLKRVYNIKSVYSSGLLTRLSSEFPGSTIILFGSYSIGEDTEESDIDIAIFGYKKRDVNLEKIEKELQRNIQLHFFENQKNIEKKLKQSIINGINLKGEIEI